MGMAEEETESTAASLEEERLQLEREALAVERERLVAARAHVEAEARLSVKTNRSVLVYALVLLLSLASFCLGFLAGRTHEQSDQRRRDNQKREQQLVPRDALSDGRESTMSTTDDETPTGGHRKVSSVVFH